MRARGQAVAVMLGVLLASTATAGEHGRFNRKHTASKQETTATARAEGIESLKAARTLGDLVRLIGASPKCQPLDEKQRICSWNISNRRPGYPILAPILDTDRRVFVICELPMDNSPREAESCTISTEGSKKNERY